MIRIHETLALMQGRPFRKALRPDFGRLAATVFGLRYDEIIFLHQDRPRVMARHAGIWAARQYGLSYPVIGRMFCRHHTTCMDAVKRARQHRWACDDFKAKSSEILRIAEAA